MENQDLMNTIEGQTTELNQEGQPDNQVRDGENAAAMIVAIDKGKLPVQIRIAGRRKFGYKEESDPHYMNDADCACEIYRDGDDYIYRDHLLPGMTMYNGKQIGGHELEGARQVQLREGDILSFRSPEGETKMRFLFHRIYDPDNVWQTADLHPEAGRYIICKHEEKTDDRELSEARSANLPKHYTYSVYEFSTESIDEDADFHSGNFDYYFPYKNKEGEYFVLSVFQESSAGANSCDFSSFNYKDGEKKIIEDFLSIKEPTKEMLHKIIDKIYINKDKEVEVHYKVCNN